jgi:hypothetical protein
LGADAGHEQRHVAHNFTDAGDLGREGGADHQTDLAGGVPLVGCQSGDALVQSLIANIEELQVGATRVGGAAEQDDPLSG